MTARTQSFRLFIMLSALLALLLLACTPDRAPTPTPVQPPTATAAPFEPAPASASAPVASETAGAAPMPSATLPATSTALPSLAATNTSLPEATAQPPASPVPADTRAPVTIDAFEVDVQDVASGKRLTFRWETTGADRVQIFAGTQQQSPPTWHGGPDGALDAELPATNYRDPPMTLVAYYAPDHLVVEETVTRTRTIEWPCQFDYFFEPEPAACPVEAPVSTWAAEQMFEHGRMLWLQEVWVGDVVQDDLIFVLYDDGRWKWYDDTWASDQPESDPSLAPPEGMVQPIRGFGKVWRENPEVRERLGWGLAPEQGHQTDWQVPFREQPPGMAYIRTIADGVVMLAGWDAGTWEFVAP